MRFFRHIKDKITKVLWQLIFELDGNLALNFESMLSLSYFVPFFILTFVTESRIVYEVDVRSNEIQDKDSLDRTEFIVMRNNIAKRKSTTDITTIKTELTQQSSASSSSTTPPTDRPKRYSPKPSMFNIIEPLLDTGSCDVCDRECFKSVCGACAIGCFLFRSPELMAAKSCKVCDQKCTLTQCVSCQLECWNRRPTSSDYLTLFGPSVFKT